MVSYVKGTPKLTLTSPSDGQTFSKDSNKATIAGQTDPTDRVTVNGYWAIVDSKGNFTYALPLQNGDNQLKIIATDDAGNTTEVDKKVIYSP